MHLISVTEYIPISIHALLAESDRAQAAHYRNGQISIHALLAESDTSPCVVMNVRRDFYPRSPCGERRPCRPRRKRPQGISIHALLAESDENSASPIRPRNYFYPRSPCGERPISFMCVPLLSYFYPRSPCGERPDATFKALLDDTFLSTLSLRRATVGFCVDYWKDAISIHALLAESDANWFDLWGWAEYFYPRSPCGERP